MNENSNLKRFMIDSFDSKTVRCVSRHLLLVGNGSNHKPEFRAYNKEKSTESWYFSIIIVVWN